MKVGNRVWVLGDGGMSRLLRAIGGDRHGDAGTRGKKKETGWGIECELI